MGNQTIIIKKFFTESEEKIRGYCQFCGSEMNYKLENKTCGFCKAHLKIKKEKTD